MNPGKVKTSTGLARIFSRYPVYILPKMFERLSKRIPYFSFVEKKKPEIVYVGRLRGEPPFYPNSLKYFFFINEHNSVRKWSLDVRRFPQHFLTSSAWIWRIANMSLFMCVLYSGWDRLIRSTSISMVGWKKSWWWYLNSVFVNSIEEMIQVRKRCSILLVVWTNHSHISVTRIVSTRSKIIFSLSWMHRPSKIWTSSRIISGMVVPGIPNSRLIYLFFWFVWWVIWLIFVWL